MKKIILLLIIFLSGCALLYLGLSFAVSHLSKWEIKGFLVKTTTKENIPVDIWRMQALESVQYTPGNNYSHLSEEDSAYHHYVYEHDGLGRISKKKCYRIGRNNAIVTSDAYLVNYIAYEYDKDRPVREICYSASGPDKKWFTADDLKDYETLYEYGEKGNKLRMVRIKSGEIIQYTAFENDPSNLIIKDVVYKGRGQDALWLTSDDEIEKYHLFWYDNGKIARIAEYRADHSGRGMDNLWFSPDDQIFATKEFSYCEDGYMSKIKKCIGPGLDKIWFTKDDIVQYYTVYNYASHPKHNLKKGT